MLAKKFEEQVTKTPAEIAVKTALETYTYEELNRYANRIARRILQVDGVKGNNPTVALLFEHGVHMIAAILGALKAGKTYVPLSLDYPLNRLSYMLSDSESSILVTLNGTAHVPLAHELAEPLDIPLLEIQPGKTIDRDYEENRDGELDPGKIAYILYTSGSTGRPKGVVQTHENADYYNRNWVQVFSIAAGDRMTLFSSFCHDGSVQDMYSALHSGACLYPVNMKNRESAVELSRFLIDEKITIWHSVPSLFSYFAGTLTGRENFPSLRFILLGGEPVRRHEARLFKKHFPHATLANVYGQTESSVNSICLIEADQRYKKSLIGTPLEETGIFVIDEDGRPVEPLEAGEIVIACKHISPDYWKNSEATKKAFNRDDEFGRIYWTGDLGRVLADGGIEFLGRRDLQIKIRGFRVELGEIESHLLKHEQIKEAAVAARTDESGDTYLCAYVVPAGAEKEIAVPRLRDFLAGELPDYMIPGFFVVLDKMPLTPNGKIDRKSLPESEREALGRGEAYTAPRDGAEKQLALIWGDVLGIDPGVIGIDANFFYLGGHSLKAVVAASMIQKAFNVEVPLARIFKTPSIRRLAQYVTETNQARYEAIQAVEEREYYPQSPAQKRLFFLDRFESVGTGYNISMALKIEGKIDKKRFEKAFKQLIHRHESLRTSFHMMDEEPVQVVHDYSDIEFSIEYLNHEGHEGHEEIDDFICRFELSQAPLFRVGLLKLAEGEREYLLLFDMHHIIGDGTSLGILIDDFIGLYSGEELALLRIGYKDFVSWQGDLTENRRIEEQESYWLSLYPAGEEIPRIDLPLDFPRPAVFSFAGDRYAFELELETATTLKEMAGRTGATLYMTLLATFNILLYKYTSKEDIVVGSGTMGRSHADLQGIAGMFVNTLPMRNRPDNRKTYLQFINEVKENSIQAFENQDVQFEDLVEKINPPRDPSRNPIFDVLFIVQNFERAKKEIKTVTVSPYSLENSTSKFDLTLFAFVDEEEKDGRISFVMEYCTALFKGETIERMAEHLLSVLRQMVENPGIGISEIDIVTEKEKRQLLFDFNDTAMDYPRDKTIHELFVEQAEKAGDRVAVIGGAQGQITYRELNKKTAYLANVLKGKGVQPETIAAIKMERSIEMIIGILGILNAGGAYLPIDTAHPRERVEYMLADSGAQVLLNDVDDVVEMSGPKGGGGGGGGGASIAYIIYTSGTTGRPKGTMIEHRSLVNLCVWHNRYYGVSERDHATQYAGIGFDASVWEIFPYLVKGALLHIIADEIKLDIEKLQDYYCRHQVTISFLPTQFCRQFMEEVSDCPSLRALLTGGDKLGRFIKRNYRLYNNYGPTENTVVTTAFPVPDAGPGGSIPIGKPTANVRVYILNSDNMQLQPQGTAGELCISGDSLSRGYLNHPELTAERFCLDFYRTYRSYMTYIYKTGDLARWLPGGNIEFLGRIDHQVKIRGFRIEPGEIENKLLNHDRIKEVVVFTRESEKRDKYLCAYIVPHGAFSSAELREYLSLELPDYMIPAYFVEMESIPLTVNGKVDREKLPGPGAAVGESAVYIAPGSEVEKKLAGLWAEVLGIGQEKIGIRGDFFRLGGHSLKVTVLAAKIHKLFAVKIPLPGFFKTPTIEWLGRYIENAKQEAYISIKAVEKREYYPVSSAQKRLYVLQQMEGAGTVYNMPAAAVLQGRLDREKLEMVIRQFIHRHETLRTSFHMVQEDLVQKINGENYKSQITNHKSQNTNMADFIQPFDLSRAPLLRVGLIRIGDERHIFMMDLHHIVSDGASQGLSFKEFMSLYNGEELPVLRIQYKDYALWQQSKREKRRVEGQKAYWLKEFEGEIPVLSLPTDFTRPTVQSFAGKQLKTVLNRDLTAGIRQMASDNKATLFMVVLSFYTLLLARISDQEDIVVGTPVAGRDHADLQPIVGMFVNTLALRNQPAGGKEFNDFLKEVKRRWLNAFANQEYLFEDLVEEVDVKRDTARNPLFDVMFSLLNLDIPPIQMSGLNLEPYPSELNISKFDMMLYCSEGREQLLLTFEYCTRLFKEETIERFAGYFKTLVWTVLDNPRQKIKDIEIISPEERKQVLYDFNDTRADYPRDKTVHGLFAEQAARRPDNIAIVGAYSSLTYKELNNKSNRLAVSLREKGVLADGIIGIMVERSIEMMIGIFAILKAGAAYLPIDPSYPQERIEFILEDSNAEVINLDSPLERGGPGGRGVFEPATCNLHLSTAYVIYTSGSTGKPKGVMVEHNSVINRLNWMQRAYPITGRDRILQKTPVVFDVSVWELFWWTFRGASLVLLGPGEEKSPEAIVEAIHNHGITTLHFVPSMLTAFLDYVEDGVDTGHLRSISRVFASGEALGVHQVKAFNRLLYSANKARLINLYGPTEATVDVSFFNCDLSGEQIPGSIPIGKPIDNIQLVILDRYLKIQPLGIAGELCIAGVGLARGYLNRPELTAEKFLFDFYRSYKSYMTYIPKRIYKSGDLARWLPDGNIQYLGRMDFQVKIRGFRIELGEIESRLLKNPGIKEAVVIAGSDRKGDVYLCAYVVGAAVNLEDLRQHLSSAVPDYMVPAHFVEMEAIPLTSNGKVDRKALPGPRTERSEDHVAPRTSTEEKLVEIWADLLDIHRENIGIDDGFFKLGGHSLKATIMIARIHKAFQVRFTLADIFKRTTIRVLARDIMGKSKEKHFSVDPAPGKSYYAVSSAQERLYVIQQMDPANIYYNMNWMFILEGVLEAGKLERAFNRVIQRHEVLRTGIEMRGIRPVQVIHAAASLAIEYMAADNEFAGGMPDPGEMTRMAREFVRPFDLSKPPPMRVRLVKIKERAHILILDLHHIATDAVSNRIIMGEVIDLYTGREPVPVGLHYKDFSEWQNRRIAGGEMQMQEEYWLRQFAGEIPRLDLPLDFPRPAVHDGRCGGVEFEINPELTAEIKELTLETGTTFYMVLLAVYNILLSRYSGQEDIIVGSAVGGRRHADLEKVVGMFINMLAIRSRPRENMTFMEFLDRVKTDTLNAYENQDYPFNELVGRLGIDIRPGRNPLFDVEFNFHNAPKRVKKEKTAEHRHPELMFKPFVYGQETLSFDLGLIAYEEHHSIRLILAYLTALFKSSTIENMTEHFVEILEKCLHDKEIKLEDIAVYDLAAGTMELTKEDVTDFQF